MKAVPLFFHKIAWLNHRSWRPRGSVTWPYKASKMIGSVEHYSRRLTGSRRPPPFFAVAARLTFHRFSSPAAVTSPPPSHQGVPCGSWSSYGNSSAITSLANAELDCHWVVIRPDLLPFLRNVNYLCRPPASISIHIRTIHIRTLSDCCGCPSLSGS